MFEDNVKIKLSNNNELEVPQETTLFHIAKSIGNSFSKKAALGYVNGDLKEITYVIKENSKVEFITYADKEAEESIKYTLAFLISYVIQKQFKSFKIADLGVDNNSFYCDFQNPIKNINKNDLKDINKALYKLIESNPTIEVSEMSKEKAKVVLADKEYMKYHIEHNDEENIKIAKIGDYVSLITYPIISNLSKLKNYKLKNISSTNWLRDVNNEPLQRISGIAFSSEEALENHESFLEKYENINHRKLGKELNLFTFSDYAPGMPFYKHNGQIIRLELQNLLRKLQFEEDYEEVYTPFIMNESLWKDSGHWDHYKDNMYFTDVDDLKYSLKPMNCPGHMLIYKNEHHSYRDLPIRMAEFGQVHRHELSGSLNGLFRVRTFNQDDAHIYINKKQIESEILNVINLIDKVYTIFGFDYDIELSTRPDDYMGDINLWDFAESSLENVLKYNNLKYTLNEKDGAFYGPKIDIHIKDALGRSHQCGTIQLDFQMPEKFDLNYINENNEKERPVVIHRAIYGSIDRFLGILLEHYSGKLPLWLSPNQVNIIPVNNKLHLHHASRIKKMLKSKGIRVNVDDAEEKMGYKIRNAQISKIPYTIVIGDDELNNHTLSVRKYNENKNEIYKIDEFIEKIVSEKVYS
ncbi:threonine--tRNA ligase [Staphylococcus xylosus]|uniref:threonine--tRNA ligase n=1 Tax=Staphylococcus xylosus TaxID=1288 RepID=UPI000D1D539F|nr:threonine--tRNA ligase [Staphylococcus xylosus]MBE6180770.1 threonine--tRNA ligase [Staphylococcus xylosus]MBG3874833.1 threonine--tRNA ligase [Staphylococcus xylosus]MEB6297344.1 threonine--tRNA ligase [Staphylococcus xylosus]PTI62237.1 threonine--tRNA ligase [Staphylococcus xylosus]RIM88144.1 threonine--tRNA ligase [Staphylococcus xylosus]